MFPEAQPEQEASPLHRAEFCLLQYASLDRPVVNIGVLLLDLTSDRLHLRLLSEWTPVAAPGVVKILALLEDDFRRQAEELGGGGVSSTAR